VTDPGDLWKRWLKHDLADLERDMAGRNWTDSDSFRGVVIERFMFVSAYIIRKLAENDELTVDLIDRDWPVRRFECVTYPPHPQQFRVTRNFQDWWQPIEDYYDLANARPASLRLKALCNLVIHHFAFEARGNHEDGIEIYFNSERTKEEHLYAVAFDRYVELVEEAAYEEAVWFGVDRKTGRPTRHRTRRWDFI
jgi:hypothetical protein